MQSPSLSSLVTIRDPRAAIVFTDSHSRRILLQFARKPRALAEVARDIGMDLKQLHHFVTRFHRLGLVQIVEERQRTGRSIKLYQCTGDRYFIPSAATPGTFSRGLAKELRSAIDRDAAASIEGMVFALDPDGRVCGTWVEKSNARPSPMDSWRILSLSAAQARQLKEELAAVLDRFQSIPGARGEVYLVHAGMARRPDHQGATDNPPPAEPGMRVEDPTPAG
jgi:hypothetical protein